MGIVQARVTAARCKLQLWQDDIRQAQNCAGSLRWAVPAESEGADFRISKHVALFNSGSGCFCRLRASTWRKFAMRLIPTKSGRPPGRPTAWCSCSPLNCENGDTCRLLEEQLSALQRRERGAVACASPLVFCRPCGLRAWPSWGDPALDLAQLPQGDMQKARESLQRKLRRCVVLKSARSTRGSPAAAQLGSLLDCSSVLLAIPALQMGPVSVW